MRKALRPNDFGIFKPSRMVVNGSQWYSMVQNGAQWCSTVLNGCEWLRTVQLGSGRLGKIGKIENANAANDNEFARMKRKQKCKRLLKNGLRV